MPGKCWTINGVSGLRFISLPPLWEQYLHHVSLIFWVSVFSTPGFHSLKQVRAHCCWSFSSRSDPEILTVENFQKVGGVCQIPVLWLLSRLLSGLGGWRGSMGWVLRSVIENVQKFSLAYDIRDTRYSKLRSCCLSVSLSKNDCICRRLNICDGYSWLSTSLHLELTKSQAAGCTSEGFSLLIKSF